MITKLTAKNSGLYYAPAFELINQALKAQGSSLEIHSIEDYFNNLKDEIIPLLVNQREDSEGNITGLRGGYLLLMPADEDIFEINANTRAISIPANIKKNGIGVYGDHNAEMIVLNIDRYFDSQDLLNTNVAINWNFTPAGARNGIFDEPQAVPAFAPNADLNPEKVTFGFIIDKNMTKGSGVLTFSVTFYTTESGVINYSFNTLTASVTINDTLSLKDPSIIHDDINNYLNRFANSVYQDNTISPVGTPVWKSGDKDSDGKYSGLEKVAYFAPEEDLRNIYEEGVLLTAYAVVNPATADVTYKWTESPLNSNVAMGRDFNTINLPSDYIEVQLPEEDNGEYYYLKNESGRIDIEHVLTWGEAKAKLEEYESNDETNYLPLKIKKLVTVPVDEENEEKTQASQENQDNTIVDVHGNIIRLVSLDELNSFILDDAEQDEGKWIGIDIDTGFETIMGINWNGYPLDVDDVLKAHAAGLPGGHIIYWVKANSIQSAPKTITLAKEGYKNTVFSVYYDGINPEEEEGTDSPVDIINTGDRPRFTIRGSSYKAHAAGNYQVSAQARISVGEHYEKVLDTSNLKVNVDYYLKDENGNIDKLNPVRNELASIAAAGGKDLYVFTSAARNSAVIESSILTIPPAVQPVVKLEVGTAYQFDVDQTGTITKIDDDPTIPEYVYLDDTQVPTLIATVTIPSPYAEDSQGAFAAELIKTDNNGHVNQITKEDIEAPGAYEFTRLPADGKFVFTPQDGEGTYLARIINRRNGTYSISDTELAETITTAFVAPQNRKLTVTGVMWDPEVEKRPTAGYQEVLVDGDRPVIDGQPTLINLEINRIHPRYTFNIVDNTEIDSTKYTGEVKKLYYIEEVDYSLADDVITPRTPDSDNHVPGTQVPYENFGEEDLREIIQENDGSLTFEITNDPGYYRIKVITIYKGTRHISYTDIFGITTH